MMGIDKHNVVESGNAPVGTELSSLDQMNRIFLSQAFEIIPVGLIKKQRRVGGIELGQFEGVGICDVVHRRIHGYWPSVSY